VTKTGCESSPHADFTTSKSVVGVGENVYFYNHSTHAIEYEWEFGDGSYSYATEPVYSYTQPGIYEVRMAALDEDQVSYAYRNIEVVGVTADFAVSSTLVEVGEAVSFFNQSAYAKGYEWDFDDGTFSYNASPEHVFNQPGIYSVSLAAYDDNYTDIVYLTIEVLPATILSIEVLEYFDKYPVEGASIILYPTYQDWLDQTNMIIEIFTDEDGIAEVALPPAVYYVDVWHDYHDNYALADEDINFIRVSGIEANTTNYFTAWVDYYDDPLRNGDKRARRKSPNKEKRIYDASR